ncbi:uncharacterized protein [Primulina huaijiensis]|uniref:uncharacterized protein n=1 Tax=Primulina huaijiensis TaxID=1492673 RepID=UPI003CC72A1C
MPPKRKNIEGDVRTPPTDKTAKVVDEFSKLLKEQAEVHGEQIQQLLSMQTTTHGRGQGRGQGRTESSEDGAYDRFRRINPPEFIGGPDPLIALEWIKSVEAIFNYLKFNYQDKVSCAVFMLVKAARIWWEATKVTVNVRELKWDSFKELFYTKYFSQEVKAKKVKEFLELRQAAMTVDEYTLKFEEGCVFVPFIAENDKDKGEHFLRGLRPEIRRAVHMAKVVAYQDIVERALLAELDEQVIEKERQLRRQTFQARSQGACPSGRGGFKGKGKLEQRNKPSLPSSDTERPLCPKCGKPHKGFSIGIPIISCLQANKLLHKGCMGFLASVVDVRKESNLQLQDIDVVQDYPDVFADDALSRKSSSLLGSMISKSLLLELQRNEINLEQQRDAQLLELKRKSDLTGLSEFGLNRDGLLIFRGRICVPMGDGIRRDVLTEAHTAPYSVHPGSTKMYQDLRRLY